MDILVTLERLLAATPEHNHSAPPLTRRQLAAAVAEISRLRTVIAELVTAEADAQARTGTNQTL
jgi:hypothetical protein